MAEAYVTRIKNIRKHSNADRLNVGECFGNQVIVSIDTKEGDLGVYFSTDTQLSIDYCANNNLVIKKDENGVNVGGYLDPNKRHIRTMKLRGEISDGLFMPISSLSFITDVKTLKEGDKIDVLNGIEICRKYVPETSKKTATKNVVNNSKSNRIKNTYPMFHEHIDTAQLAYNLHSFNEGDICYITLKQHGTSHRISNTIKKNITPYTGIKKAISKLLKRPPYDMQVSWEYISGTRRTVLENYSSGYYKTNDFRRKADELFKGKLRKGETVYMELVGYEDSGKPIMSTTSNEKVSDKEFIKKYGKTTTYSYGCDVGESDVYIYRMTMVNEDGIEIDYPWDLVKLRAEQMGVKTVPEFDRFIFTTQDDLMERVNKYIDGEDPIGKTHIREGVVVRIEGKERFKAFKAKNTYFKILEGIIKDSGIVDMEEQESIGEENE